jgi:hypothetical protein
MGLRNVSVAVLTVIGTCFLQAQSPAPVSPTITMHPELLKRLDACHAQASQSKGSAC